MVVLLMLLSAGLLWGSSALSWVSATFRTPYSGDVQSGATGSMVRPELVPLALASLAGIAAVLATGGWMRRIIGGITVLGGGLLVWRAVSWHLDGDFGFTPPNLPPNSAPIGVPDPIPFGPLLMGLAALTLLNAGLLVAARAKRMPAMGSRYSAPGARRESRDPDKRLWEALDEGADPTDER